MVFYSICSKEVCFLGFYQVYSLSISEMGVD